MRMEDLDGPRNKPDAAQQALDILQWLGLDYEGELLVQSHDFTPYRHAMHTLAQQRVVYACQLSRSEIAAAASAPHDPPRSTAQQPFGQELHFPTHLRPEDDAAYRFDDEQTNYRFVVQQETLVIDDAFAGRSEQCPYDDVGDFVIWTRSGGPAYQLAVVVDDARQGVTDVFRGDDLLRSAARQELLYRALGWAAPRWWHVPLVLGPDGRRLAKRHGDTRISTYREAGVRPERVIGLLARMCNLVTDRCEMSIADFLDGFSLDSLSREPVTFTKDDHRWLIAD